MSGTENLTRAEARDRAEHLAVSDYAVSVDVTGDDDRTFGSSSTISFTSSAPGRSAFVDFLADEVSRIVLNGEELDPATAFDGARVHLPAVAAENELTVTGRGVYSRSGEGLHRFVDPVDDEPYLYTQFEVSDARRMFACFEQPDLKARFAFTVRAPESWTVISNTPAVEPERHGDGTATWAFAPTEILPTYLTALIAGPYRGTTESLTTRDGREIPVGVWSRASLWEHVDAENIIGITRTGISYYEEKFDQDYPFPTVGHIFVPEYNFGAMENPGAITYVEKYVFRSEVSDAVRERRDLTILHELAHHWFGDLVTMQWWDDLWLNESFAEFASTTCMAEATGWDGAWTTFSVHEKTWAYSEDQRPTTHPIVADMVDLETVETNFDGITYAKGASVLRQLVAYVGEDAFFAGLRAYFAKHRWGNTQLQDLLVELEATSGRDLRTWSALWLETAGTNLLRPEIERDASGAVTSFAILQETPEAYPTQRPHRLVVGGYTLQGDVLRRTERIELDVDGPRTEVPGLVGRTADLWLVNDEDLAYAKVRLDEHSLATATTQLSAISDPLARILVWGAAWDMVRDAEMPATQFVDLLLRNIGGETAGSVLSQLLNRLRGALAHYVADDRRTDVQADAADRVWDLARAAAPGSDAQFQYLTAFADLAVAPEQLDVVAGLRDGSTTLPGREIDTDLAWTLLVSLATAGRAGEDEIAAQLAADDTFNGAKAAATARAARPDGKAEAWRIAMEQDDLPNETLSAVGAGFGRTHDRGVLAPFVGPYFERVDGIWERRTSELATRAISGFFPLAVGGQDVLDRVDAWLANHSDAPFGLVRPHREFRDDLARILRAQECDAAHWAGTAV
jgi:aminopeptidase N